MMATRLLTILALAATAGLVGCGRKGALDTPYQAALDAREAAEDEGKPLPPKPAEPVKDRPFILDGLIQ